MSSLLTAIDIFGVAYTLKTNGKDKYRTKLGGCFTIACFITMVFFTMVFGMDFFKKINPEVSRNDFEHDKPQYMPLKSNNYMVRVGNSENFNSPSYPYKPYGGYQHFIQKANGSLEIVCNSFAVISPCTATDAMKNPDLTDFILSDWYCIDTKKITNHCKKQMKVESYEPFIGGNIGDDTVSVVRIGVSNTVFDENANIIEQASLEQLRIKTGIMMDYAYPKAYYDSNKVKDALITKMTVDRFEINADNYNLQFFFFKQVKLFDDIGWLLENNETSHSIILDSVQPMQFKADLTKEGLKFFFQGIYYLNRSELQHKRRFMKFQDVLAQVSAFVKGIVQIFFFFAASYASYYMMSEMMTGYFGLERVAVEIVKPSKLIGAKDVEKVDTIVNSSTANIKKNKETVSGQLGYLMFVFSCWSKQNAQTKSSLEFYRMAKDHIEKRLDVISLLKLLDGFDRLVEKTLSEEDQLDLQGSHSINKL